MEWWINTQCSDPLVGYGCGECLVNNMHQLVLYQLWNLAMVGSWCSHFSPERGLISLLLYVAVPWHMLHWHFNYFTVEDQFKDDHCVFQHDWAPIHIAGVHAEWAAIPQETFCHLIESMPARVKAVIKTKGGPTPYWLPEFLTEGGPNLYIIIRWVSGYFWWHSSNKQENFNGKL